MVLNPTNISCTFFALHYIDLIAHEQITWIWEQMGNVNTYYDICHFFYGT